jgi:Tfp pilus assembly protein PilN
VIRSNLSTRPFYNDRAVRLFLLLGLVLVVVATLFNVTRMLRYSGTNTELAAQAARDESRAAELQASAASLRGSVDPKQIDAASTDARQANDLIDRRTFSWTDLLNRFETTLPDDVRIIAVRPRVDRQKGILLRVNVTARGVDDVAEFMENLEATGAFKDARPAEEHFDEQGLLQTTLEMGYEPSAAKPTAAEAAENKTAAEPTDAATAASPEPAAPAGRRGRAPR